MTKCLIWTSFVQFSTENIAVLSLFMKSIDFTEKPLRTNLMIITNATFCMVAELCSSTGLKVMAYYRPRMCVSEQKNGPKEAHSGQNSSFCENYITDTYVKIWF